MLALQFVNQCSVCFTVVVAVRIELGGAIPRDPPQLISELLVGKQLHQAHFF